MMRYRKGRDSCLTFWLLGTEVLETELVSRPVYVRALPCTSHPFRVRHLLNS